VPGELRGLLYTKNSQKVMLNIKLKSVPCSNEMRPCRVEEKERAIRIAHLSTLLALGGCSWLVYLLIK